MSFDLDRGTAAQWTDFGTPVVWTRLARVANHLFNCGKFDLAAELVDRLNVSILESLQSAAHDSPFAHRAALRRVLFFVTTVSGRLSPQSRRFWQWSFVDDFASDI
jgi:hypothetical protein